MIPRLNSVRSACVQLRGFILSATRSLPFWVPCAISTPQIHYLSSKIGGFDEFRRYLSESRNGSKGIEKEVKEKEASATASHQRGSNYYELLVDESVSNESRRKVVDHIVQNKITLTSEQWDKTIYALSGNRQLTSVLKIYDYLISKNEIQNASPTSYRYFLQAAGKLEKLDVLRQIWGEFLQLRLAQRKEFYLTHAMYMKGLLACHEIKEAFAEYHNYNPFNGVNNTVNTIFLEGLKDGACFGDCVLLFTAILLNIRMEIRPEDIQLVPKASLYVKWEQVLQRTMREKPSRDFSKAVYFTKESYFDATIENRAKYDTHSDHAFFLGKRAYDMAIQCCVALRYLDYADMLLTSLRNYKIRPRKSTYYALVDCIASNSLDELFADVYSVLRNECQAKINPHDKHLLRQAIYLNMNGALLPYLQGYQTIYGAFSRKDETNSTIYMDVSALPSHTAEHAFLATLLQIGKNVQTNYLWLKGTLSIKVNLKDRVILDFLRSGAFPEIKHNLNGFILRIPILSIANWYAEKNNYMNPELKRFLSIVKCNYHVNEGKDGDTFFYVRAMEFFSKEGENREVPSLEDSLKEMEAFVAKSLRNDKEICLENRKVVKPF